MANRQLGGFDFFGDAFGYLLVAFVALLAVTLIVGSTLSLVRHARRRVRPASSSEPVNRPATTEPSGSMIAGRA